MAKFLTDRLSVRSFANGSMLARPLSYFREIEDPARRDPDEGYRRHRSAAGKPESPNSYFTRVAEFSSGPLPCQSSWSSDTNDRDADPRWSSGSRAQSGWIWRMGQLSDMDLTPRRDRVDRPAPPRTEPHRSARARSPQVSIPRPELVAKAEVAVNKAAEAACLPAMRTDSPAISVRRT